jgi:hypothetical protein
MHRTDRRDLSRESSSPARTSPPLAVLVAVAAPPLLFAATYRASRRFRDFVLAIDLRLLTAIQGWRVLGGMFPRPLRVRSSSGRRRLAGRRR